GVSMCLACRYFWKISSTLWAQNKYESNSRWCFRFSASFRLEVGRLDDRPTAFGLGFLERTQRFRRLLRERRDLDAKLLEALFHRGIGEGLHRRRIQPGNDLLRRILGYPKSVPERSKEVGQTRLVRGCNIRRRRQ